MTRSEQGIFGKYTPGCLLGKLRKGLVCVKFVMLWSNVIVVVIFLTWQRDVYWHMLNTKLGIDCLPSPPRSVQTKVQCPTSLHSPLISPPVFSLPRQKYWSRAAAFLSIHQHHHQHHPSPLTLTLSRRGETRNYKNSSFNLQLAGGLESKWSISIK